MIEALVVDDHTIFRSGLRRLLSDEPDMRVAGEAGNAADAMQALRRRPVDVVILDINLKGRSGLEMLTGLRREWPTLPVLMVSMYPEEQFARAALEAGANGYVPKDAEPGDLLAAIRSVAQGGSAFAPAMAPRAREAEPAVGEGPPHFRLSAREMQIMAAIVAGKSLTEVGAELFLSVKTISTYRTRILEKLQLGSNSELVRYAMQHGLLD
ncbi:MAG TPA: response regulator transcription factor [Rhodocyclaceae bacterium]|nr:response regulator transcription factor [Rhodocyclaceae bacterium]HNH35186.1 response regulator transcription factor [Rhodocyclaceae bacterium]